MSCFRTSSFIRFNQPLGRIRTLALVSAVLLMTGTPALAHHAMDGGLPTNFFQGFLSGLAHPVIGFDHFAFVVAVGLLAAIKQQGIPITIAFVVSAMAGTGLHLTGLSVPGVEFLIAGSILLFGLLLALKNSWNTATVAGLCAIAGLCHGYAYGEAIFGAETTPLIAYLAGFTATQLAIAMSAFGIGHFLIQHSEKALTTIRSAGWVICGIGLAFLSSQVIAAVFPNV